MSIKVAQVCPAYYPHIGGVETCVREISERLVKLGISIEVLTADPSGKHPEKEMINGVVVRRFRCWSVSRTRFPVPELTRYLKANRNQFDIIHAHNFYDFPALQAALAKGDCRLVLNPYYQGNPAATPGFLYTPYKSLWRRFLARVDRVICISQSEKQLFRQNFSIPDEKFLIIAPGVNAEAIRIAQPYDFPGKLVLYVGRLEKYKNIQAVIEAMPYLPEEYRFHIIGTGPYRDQLEGLIQRLGLDNRVEILSGLPDEQVHRWYRTADIFVTLSSHEAFGITALEAIAALKPVIVSNQDALLEFSKQFDGVFAIDPGRLSPRELAEVIAQRSVSVSRAPDLGEYDWDSIAKRVLSAYQSLLVT